MPVLSRLAAAVFGGYALATLVSILLARALPLPRAEAVLTGVLASFAFYAGAVVWAFAARSAGRAWLGLAAPAALCGALAWLLQAGGGR